MSDHVHRKHQAELQELHLPNYTHLTGTAPTQLYHHVFRTNLNNFTVSWTQNIDISVLSQHTKCWKRPWANCVIISKNAQETTNSVPMFI